MTRISKRVLVFLLLTTASLTSQSVGAETIRRYTTFDDAVRGWLDAYGLSARGGYGRYEDDRKGAQAMLEAANRTGLPFVPRALPGAPGDGWAWAAVAKGEGASGHCVLAGAHMGLQTWRHFAQRGVTERPLVAELDCKWVTVTAVVRDPSIPRKHKDLDTIRLTVRSKENGAIIEDEHAVLGLAVADVKRVEGRQGIDYEEAMLAEHIYGLGAAAIGHTRVEPTASDTTRALHDSRFVRCFTEPALSPAFAIHCGGRFETDDARICASLGLRSFIDLVATRTAGGVAANQPLGIWFTCGGGHRGTVMSTSDTEATMTFFGTESTKELWTANIPVVRLVARERHKVDADQVAGLAAKHMTPSPRTTDGRLAWYGARIQTLVELFGAAKDERKNAADIDLALLTQDVVASLASGRAKVTCEPKPKERGAFRSCLAKPAIDLPRASCLAVAWGLASALPHMPKAPFGKQEAVELEVFCGSEAGFGASVTALRSPPVKGFVPLVLKAGPHRAKATDDDCEDDYLGLACDDNETAAPPLPVWEVSLTAPADPGTLVPPKAPRGPKTR